MAKSSGSMKAEGSSDRDFESHGRGGAVPSGASAITVRPLTVKVRAHPLLTTGQLGETDWIAEGKANEFDARLPQPFAAGPSFRRLSSFRASGDDRRSAHRSLRRLPATPHEAAGVLILRRRVRARVFYKDCVSSRS